MERSAVILVLQVVAVLSDNNKFLYHDGKLYEGSTCKTADGRNGVCHDNCTTLTREQLSDRKNICGFEKSKIVICCPRILIDSSVEHPTILQACVDRQQKLEERIRTALDVEERSNYEYGVLAAFEEEYRSMRPRKNKQLMEHCRREAAEIGGAEGKYYAYWCGSLILRPSDVSPSAIFPAVLNEHPHMAALGWTNENNVTSWDCGGALIHRSFVLTAAHCLSNIGTPPDVIRIGDIDLSQEWDDKFAVDYDVEAAFVHEGYEPAKYYNDIALLKIKKRGKFRYKLPPLPACVWTERKFPVNKLLMMGYGSPAFGKKHLGKLFQGNLTILPYEDCVKRYDPSEELPNGVQENQICATDPEGLLDTCEGDSGGPLQFTAQDDLRTPYLVGVTSFGRLCLDGNPGVYTRIHDFLDWMEKTMSANK